MCAVLMLGLLAACSFTPKYKTIRYEYYVPPTEQISGEHKTISLTWQGEKLTPPKGYPQSETLRLKWIANENNADVQVRIHIKPSALRHNHNYYYESTKFKVNRPMQALYQARIKAHIQTDYEVEIRDRKKDEVILFYQGGRQFYFESLEYTEQLSESESTLVKDFYKHEPDARQAVVDYLWDNMRGERYSLLAKVKAKVMGEDFDILTEHPEQKRFAEAYKQLKQTNKKLIAPQVKQHYSSLVAKLQAIKPEERDAEQQLLLESAQQGLKAADYILNNPYAPKL